MPRRIYIDSSRVYVLGGNSGIPRVVRNIVNNASNIKNNEIIPVAFSYNNFYAVKKVPFKSELLLKVLKKIKGFIFPYRKKKGGGIEKRPAIRINAYNLLSAPLLLRKKVVFHRGDILVTTDNFLMMAFSDSLSKLKLSGVIIGSIQYDLIPIRNKEFYPEEDINNYKLHLDNSIRLSDFFLTISEFVKNDLIRYIRETGVRNNIKIESFRLGYNLDNTRIDKNISEIINELFRKPTYICVSTIEPRKNHTYLMDAFEKIWEKGILVNLVIIGKIGWMCDQIISRIKNHQQYGKQLFMFNSVSDTELLYCYKNAKALVIPSVTEGFGLPIIESLSQKTLVLASDIPIFNEVGKDFCSYFNLKDSNSLANIIIKWETTGQKPNHRNLDEFKWPTWKESTEELFSKIEEILR